MSQAFVVMRVRLNGITALCEATQPNRIAGFASSALQPIAFAVVVAVVEVEGEARTPIIAAAATPVIAVSIATREIAARAVVAVLAP